METTARAEWEAIAKRIAPYQADALEENATDMGLPVESAEWFEECVTQAQIQDLAI